MRVNRIVKEYSKVIRSACLTGRGQSLSNASYYDYFCRYDLSAAILENLYDVLSVYLIEVVDIFFFLYYVAAENFPEQLAVCPQTSGDGKEESLKNKYVPQ